MNPIYKYFFGKYNNIEIQNKNAKHKSNKDNIENLLHIHYNNITENIVYNYLVEAHNIDILMFDYINDGKSVKIKNYKFCQYIKNNIPKITDIKGLPSVGGKILFLFYNFYFTKFVKNYYDYNELIKLNQTRRFSINFEPYNQELLKVLKLIVGSNDYLIPDIMNIVLSYFLY